MDMKKCEYCGKMFQPATKRNKFCGKSCSGAANRERTRKRDALVRAKRNQTEKTDLDDIANAATAAGTSYGKYVAKMGL